MLTSFLPHSHSHSHSQVIGRFRSSRAPADTFADRLELENVWLPWSSQVSLLMASEDLSDCRPH